MKNPATTGGAIHNDNFLSVSDEAKISNLSEPSANQSINKNCFDTKIISYLKKLPHLEFSATGINNIVNRFGITPEQLAALVDLLRNKGNLQ
jgi:hypothetical protein